MRFLSKDIKQLLNTHESFGKFEIKKIIEMATVPAIITSINGDIVDTFKRRTFSETIVFTYVDRQNILFSITDSYIKNDNKIDTRVSDLWGETVECEELNND